MSEGILTTLLSPSYVRPLRRRGALIAAECVAIAGFIPHAPAVYREPGGVPTPPNLRPMSRAGSALAKGLPQAASIRERPCGRGVGVAG